MVQLPTTLNVQTQVVIVLVQQAIVGRCAQNVFQDGIGYQLKALAQVCIVKVFLQEQSTIVMNCFQNVLVILLVQPPILLIVLTTVGIVLVQLVTVEKFAQNVFLDGFGLQLRAPVQVSYLFDLTGL